MILHIYHVKELERHSCKKRIQIFTYYVQSGIQGSGWPVELCIPALFLRSRLL
ncbi:hypothetical protein BN2127_JRS8_02610 [Bacillus sp. CN2]|nr:hypothetical protein BN2127_JRS8_02610 [Bacillus sp. CN2]